MPCDAPEALVEQYGSWLKLVRRLTIRRLLPTSVALLLLPVLVVIQMPAHALDPGKAVTHYTHDLWLPDDGLPQVSLQAMIQTRDGYIWLGTQEGLVRFDGVRFVVFSDRNTVAIENNNIRALHEGRDGSLWIGTYGGGLVRYKDKVFTALTSADGLSSDVVLSVLESRDGDLWIGTDTGLTRRKDETFTVYRTDDGLSHDRVLALLEDEDGVIWIGTRGGGINRFAEERFSVLSTAEGLSSDEVLALHKDSHGTIWIGTQGGGLNRFADGTLLQAVGEGGFPSETAISFCEDRDGNLWIGTLNDGIIRYDGETFVSYTTAEGLSHDRVTSILEDLEGSIWIGTYGGGLNRLRDAKFVGLGTHEGLSGDIAWTVYQDRRGGIWVGTEKGLNLLENGRFVTFPVQEAVATVSVLSMVEDREGSLWIGTYGGGIKRLRDGAWTTFSTEDGLVNDNVFAVAEGEPGVIWAGTHGGLTRIAGDQATSFTTDDGLPHDSVRSLFRDREGTLWIGTRGGGIALLDSGVFSEFEPGIELNPAQNNIAAIHQDEEGTMWFGTAGGLVRVRAGKTTVVTAREGLYDNNMHVVLEDDKSNLWMSCNRGIFRISKKEFDEFAQGHITSIGSVWYGRSHGMRSEECNGGSHPAGWRSEDGRMWFPTVAGVVAVDPANMATNLLPPPVEVEKVLINGESFDIRTRPVLPPESRRFEFHYTAMTFLGPDQVKFRFMLDGLDREWIDAGTRRTAYYDNVPPGEYEFKVVACNSDGVWNDTGDSFSFALRPHFYQRVSFFVLCALCLVILAGSIQGIRIRQLRVRQRELVAAVEDRTRELKDLSLGDPLTGLRNRRFLFETIPQVVADITRQRSILATGRSDNRVQKLGNGMGVFMIDIDHFKEVNDTYGHAVGDQVLKQFANVLSRCIRADDTAVRWGGEEFLVVLPHTVISSMKEFAERLRTQVESTEFVLPDSPTIRLTCSVGLASYPFLVVSGVSQELTLDQLINFADYGLYLAKKEGRNRTIQIVGGDGLLENSTDVAMTIASMDSAASEGYLKIRR